MVKGAESFGFNQEVPIDLPEPAISSFPPLSAVAKDPPKLAQASIGQNDVTATPLQIAMSTAAVANNGIIMKPHVMTEVRDQERNVVERYAPEPWLQPMDPAAAATLAGDMVQVVERGTGTNARIAGFTVGGKTGTAQIGDTGRLNTWFTGFAGKPGQPPSVAVAVVVLNVPNTGNEATGGVIAAPIARQVMQKVLETQG
jgi:peptidoglycan glycosyltransferase